MKSRIAVLFFILHLVLSGQNLSEIKSKDNYDKYNFYPLGGGHVKIESKSSGKTWVKNFNDVTWESNPKVPVLNIDLYCPECCLQNIIPNPWRA